MTTTSAGTRRPSPGGGRAVLLTDDEVVAVAVDLKTHWPGALPTVASDDRTSLAATSSRGHRSLLVRDLLVDGSVGGSRGPGPATAVAGATAHVTVFLADDTFERASWGIASTHYPTAGGWVLGTISPTGVHHLSPQPEEDQRRYMAAILDGAPRFGPTASSGDDTAGAETGQSRSRPAQPTSVCVLAVGPEGPLMATARRGEVGVAAVDLEGGRIRRADVVASVPASAVSCAMRAAKAPAEAVR